MNEVGLRGRRCGFVAHGQRDGVVAGIGVGEGGVPVRRIHCTVVVEVPLPGNDGVIGVEGAVGEGHDQGCPTVDGGGGEVRDGRFIFCGEAPDGTGGLVVLAVARHNLPVVGREAAQMAGRPVRRPAAVGQRRCGRGAEVDEIDHGIPAVRIHGRGPTEDCSRGEDIREAVGNAGIGDCRRGLIGRRASQRGGFHQAVAEVVVNVVNGGAVAVLHPRQPLHGVIGILHRLRKRTACHGTKERRQHQPFRLPKLCAHSVTPQSPHVACRGREPAFHSESISELSDCPRPLFPLSGFTSLQADPFSFHRQPPLNLFQNSLKQKHPFLLLLSGILLPKQNHPDNI